MGWPAPMRGSFSFFWPAGQLASTHHPASPLVSPHMQTGAKHDYRAVDLHDKCVQRGAKGYTAPSAAQPLAERPCAVPLPSPLWLIFSLLNLGRVH